MHLVPPPFRRYLTSASQDSPARIVYMEKARLAGCLRQVDRVPRVGEAGYPV